MARNGSGVYSLPAGSTVSDGQTGEASQHNTPLLDLETDMNTARPVVAGGTGATSASAALANLGGAPLAGATFTGAVALSYDNAALSVDDTGGVLGGTVDAGVVLKANGTEQAYLGFFSTTSGVMILRNEKGNVVIGADETNAAADSNVKINVDSATQAEFTPTANTLSAQADGTGVHALITENTTENLLTVRGDGLVTSTQTYDDFTTAVAANLYVNSSGQFRRSTSTGEFKIDRKKLGKAANVVAPGVRADINVQDVISLLEPLEFKSTHKADGGRVLAGFIAEDVAKAYPLASTDGGQNYDVRAIVAVNVAATQELQQTVADLKARLEALEA